MKDYTFTTRNVTAGERNTAGKMVLHHLGDITLTLEGMTRTEVANWVDITDALNTRGIDEETFRLTVTGWKVVHPEAGTVGLLFQGYGSRVHVEWFDAVNEDFFSAGWVRNLRHGVAAVINARQHVGQGLSADVQPKPIKTATLVRPVPLEDGTLVRYHGSLVQFIDGIFRVHECSIFDECEHSDCEGYALLPVDSWQPCAVHVGLDSVTALAMELAAAA